MNLADCVLAVVLGLQAAAQIPGSGYGCDLPCNTADVNYVLEATIDTYKVPGSRRMGDMAFEVDGGGLHETPAENENSSVVNLVWGPGSRPSTNHSDFYVRSRVFVDGGSESPHCFGDNGTSGILGPCLQVSPGQSLMIKLVNKMADGMKTLEEHLPSTAEWYAAKYFFSPTQDGPEHEFMQTLIPKGDVHTGKWPKSKDGDVRLDSNVQNLPGWQTGEDAHGNHYGFDVVNLHLHGMNVQPHLFHPQGTLDPDADWISVEPDDHNGRQCHCYRFEVAEDQSPGTYFYHSHRHGSSALQAWGGMLGPLLVVPASNSSSSNSSQANSRENSESSLDAELAELGIEDAVFVSWEGVWQPVYRNYSNGSDGSFPEKIIAAPTDFMDAQSGGTTFMPQHAFRPVFVNNAFQPFIGKTQANSVRTLLQGHLEAPPVTIDVDQYLRPFEPLRLRIICASPNNFCGFAIRKAFDNGTVDAAGEYLPFYNVASDGVSFDRAIARNYLLLAGGQREDVIILGPAGLYSVFKQGQADVGMLGLGTTDQRLAQILVTGTEWPGGKDLPEYLTYVSRRTLINHAPKGHFTPGKPKSRDIKPEEISRVRTITFTTMLADDKIPYLQFYQNDVAYDKHRINEIVSVSPDEQVEEWRIQTGDDTMHSIHIHVNEFQVKEVRSDYCAAMLLNGTACMKLLGMPNYEMMVTQQLDYGPRWRDTLVVPPYSFIKLWIRFDKRYVGKTVFHCHLVSHEDTGMMSNLLLTNETAKVKSKLNYDGYTVAGLHAAQVQEQKANDEYLSKNGLV